MARSKYQRWLSREGLARLVQWVHEGAGPKELANRMGVRVATLNGWRRRFPELERVVCGEEDEDVRVENALLQKALEGNTTAQMFWLKNRKPAVWRERPEPTAAQSGVSQLVAAIVGSEKSGGKKKGGAGARAQGAAGEDMIVKKARDEDKAPDKTGGKCQDEETASVADAAGARSKVPAGDDARGEDRAQVEKNAQDKIEGNCRDEEKTPVADTAGAHNKVPPRDGARGRDKAQAKDKIRDKVRDQDTRECQGKAKAQSEVAANKPVAAWERAHTQGKNRAPLFWMEKKRRMAVAAGDDGELRKGGGKP